MLSQTHSHPSSHWKTFSYWGHSLSGCPPHILRSVWVDVLCSTSYLGEAQFTLFWFCETTTALEINTKAWYLFRKGLNMVVQMRVRFAIRVVTWPSHISLTQAKWKCQEEEQCWPRFDCVRGSPLPEISLDPCNLWWSHCGWQQTLKEKCGGERIENEKWRSNYMPRETAEPWTLFPQTCGKAGTICSDWDWCLHSVCSLHLKK